MKKVLILCLALVITVGTVVTGTVAYLSDTDSDVNVMTLGNVDIEQIEQERVDYADDNNEHKLEDFKNGEKPLFPAVYEGSSIPWADEEDWVVPNNPAWKVVQDNENVVDKFVTVKNTGKSEAYVRTWFAFECTQDPATQGDLIHAVINDNTNCPGELTAWTWLPGTYEIDGSWYQIGCVTYLKPVAPDATTIPSLKQVYMDKTADNEYVAAFGDTYEILVVSQAIQAQGFPNATDALVEGFGAIEAENHPFEGMDVDGSEGTKVEVTAENLADVDFKQDNAVFLLSGDFSVPVTLNVEEGLNQTYDASNANFEGEGTVTIKAPGVAHAYSSLKAEREGIVTVKGFEVGTLNVLAYNNEKVVIEDNKVNAMSVIGGNFELVIDGNLVDGNFGKYTDGEGQNNEYGVSLRITDYELSFTNNTITDVYSHAIGINGRQGEESSDWGACGANNKIKAFSGNKITVNTTYKNERAALKIWCDQVYAPYATSGQNPNAAAEALMASIKADTTNVFTLGSGHTTFNIFDYKG